MHNIDYIRFSFSKNYEKTCLVVLGSNPDFVVGRPDIIYTGNIKHDLCLQAYAMSDAMIHLAWLDHCPNVVVEALSQKCPVICTDSGGTKEIVASGGFILPEPEQYNFELTDYDSPYSLDLSLLQNLSVEDLEVDGSKIDLLNTADAYERILVGNENILVSP